VKPKNGSGQELHFGQFLRLTGGQGSERTLRSNGRERGLQRRSPPAVLDSEPVVEQEKRGKKTGKKKKTVKRCASLEE
jgi:hypothetical protein